MKFFAYVETNNVGSRVTVPFTVPDEDVEDLEGFNRDVVIEEYAKDAIGAIYEWGWYG